MHTRCNVTDAAMQTGWNPYPQYRPGFPMAALLVGCSSSTCEVLSDGVLVPRPRAAQSSRPVPAGITTKSVTACTRHLCACVAEAAHLLCAVDGLRVHAAAAVATRWNTVSSRMCQENTSLRYVRCQIEKHAKST